MIEAGEAVCDVINGLLIKLEPHLSHEWQLSYSAEKAWSLKNEPKVKKTHILRFLTGKWMEIKSVGELVGTSSLRGMKVLPLIIPTLT